MRAGHKDRAVSRDPPKRVAVSQHLVTQFRVVGYEPEQQVTLAAAGDSCCDVVAPVRKARLADARLAGDEQEATLARPRCGEGGLDLGQLPLSPDQGRVCHRGL
jgi:hypothetical protein